MTMKKRKAGVALAVILGIVVTGCAKAPETEVLSNGVAQAIAGSDSAIESIVRGQDEGNSDVQQEKTVSEDVTDDEPEETQESITTLKKNIGSGENSMQLDAQVVGTQVQTITAGSARINGELLDRQGIKDTLFAGEQVTEDTPEAQAAENGEENIDTSTQMHTDKSYTLANAEGTKNFTTTETAGFVYNDDTLLKNYGKLDQQGTTEKAGVDVSADYTESMAMSQLEAVLSAIVNIPCQIVSATAVYTEDQEGYYKLVFAPVLDNIPFLITEQSTPTDLAEVTGTAQIGKEGIAMLYADSFLWEENEKGEAQQIISQDTVMQLLEKYVQDQNLQVSSDITYTKMLLSWMPVRKDAETAKLIPVWRIYTPFNEAITSGMLDIAAEKGVPTDIWINAVDGSLVRTQ